MKKLAVSITVCTPCCHTYLPDSPILYVFQSFILPAFPLLHKKMAQPARVAFAQTAEVYLTAT